MARVVVVGGGFGGIASAARLAKLGHQVTLLERLPKLGGALGTATRDGFTWDAGPSATLLPAVVRDLFRKTGRPLEREIDLVPQPIIRTHHFEDDSTVALPGGSRAAQIEAVEALGPGLGEAWASYVEGFADDWEAIRRDYLERPWLPEFADKQTTARIFTRAVLAKQIKKSLRDERLRLLAAHPFVFDGHDPRDVPAWMGMVAYVEQRFGAWTIEGGLSRLVEVLTQRLATRKVEVHLATEARDVVVREGRTVAVATDAGDIDADIVVCAVDPRLLPTLAGHVRRTMPAIPPVVCHLGLSADAPDLPAESVFHGDPMMVVRTGGSGPGSGRAVTLMARGLVSEDVVLALVRKGLDLRPFIVTRLDRSPRTQAEHWGGSPMGVLWQGRATLKDRLSTTTPVPGVYAAGAHVSPGSGIPFVGLSAALVAQAVGPA